MNNTLISIVGPTAIGKTALSIEVARALDTEIISADSRQFFREMKIGTAVPSSEELAAAPHHFIQHISVEDPYSVGDFERDALQKLEQLFESHKEVVMVGGSGLYVDAVTKGLDEFPKIDPGIRAALNEVYASQGLGALQEQLRNLDPEYYSEVDKENPHRLIRALEVSLGTGKPYSSFRRKKTPQRAFKSLLVGLTAEREVIYDRINRRVDIMMEQGLLEEAQSLVERKHLNALNTVGYKELFQYLEGKISLEVAVAEIKKNTRRFAKRQPTWFRKNPDIHWFDHRTPPAEIIAFIKEFTRS